MSRRQAVISGNSSEKRLRMKIGHLWFTSSEYNAGRLNACIRLGQDHNRADE